VRNLPTPPEGLGGMHSPNYVGNIFFGDLGFLIVDHSGFEVYKSTAGNISGDEARGAGAGAKGEVREDDVGEGLERRHCSAHEEFLRRDPRARL
jgi:hypothetical protein